MLLRVLLINVFKLNTPVNVASLNEFLKAKRLESNHGRSLGIFHDLNKREELTRTLVSQHDFGTADKR